MIILLAYVYTAKERLRTAKRDRRPPAINTVTDLLININGCGNLCRACFLALQPSGVAAQTSASLEQEGSDAIT